MCQYGFLPKLCVWKTKQMKSRKEKKNEKLELVHTNVWGPSHISFLGGSHYHFTFIDDSWLKMILERN